ncbi:MAG: phosphoribosyltransferase [Ekhidna sp.]|nr:phosphoribosyltransferase [Ekhidna sp.]MBC6425921.1 phosphoribosyltransferase [Ekhidna sp.]
MKANQILSSSKVDQIVQRMAYQIYENNMEEEIALIGVDNGGRKLAERIDVTLTEISGEKSICYTILLDKENPLSKEISLDAAISELEGKTIILCDDVLNTGKTLAHSLSRLLLLKVKKVETAVLVLRAHGKFPIYANYKGYELSTTINEHVQVIPGEGVFLS